MAEKALTKKQERLAEKAIVACAKYLESHGWAVVVGGFDGVQGPAPGEFSQTFRLLFKFTGRRPRRKRHEPHQAPDGRATL